MHESYCLHIEQHADARVTHRAHRTVLFFRLRLEIRRAYLSHQLTDLLLEVIELELVGTMAATR